MKGGGKLMFGEHDAISNIRASPSSREPTTQVFIKDVDSRNRYDVISIVNQGDDTRSLGGWVIVTLSGFFVYKVPLEVSVEPGCQLKIACSSNTSVTKKYDLVWKRYKRLNSNGDEILLVNGSGDVVDRCQYGRFQEKT